MKLPIALVVERREDIPEAVRKARSLPVWDGRRAIPVTHSAIYTARRIQDGWRVEWEAEA